MHVMKTGLAKLALLSGLVAGVVGDALPPEDIPVECATICGPIIELTSKCTQKWQRLVKREQQDAIMRREWVPKLAVEPPEGNKEEEEEADGGIEPREVIIFLPSPDKTTSTTTSTTSSSTPLNLQPSTVPTRITLVTETSTSSSSSTSTSSDAQPTEAQSTSTSAAEPSTSTSTVTTLITFTKTSETSSTTTSSSTSSEPESTMTSSLQIQEPQGQLYMQDNGEEDCVCLATSFDVAKVTALCASCVAQNGFSDRNIQVIMDGCNFTALTYTASDDSVVDNVRVKAVGPSSSATSRAGQLAARNAAAAWGFVLAVAAMA